MSRNCTGGSRVDPDYAHRPILDWRDMPTFRSEGLSLTVDDVDRSVAFYVGKLGLELVHLASPAFAMVRNGDGGLIGLLSLGEAGKEGVAGASPEQHRGIHVEFTTDDLDGMYATLVARGVVFDTPPHVEQWERVMTAFDPDGYSVEIAEGRRGQSGATWDNANGS